MLKMTKTLLLLFICQAALANDTEIKLATLSPHLTELVYSAGASEHLVGVSAYSNYPKQAQQLPVIGDAFSINQEILLQLKPDYVFYWKSNIAKQMVQQIENLGLVAMPITTDSIEDIPQAINQIAQLAGTTPNKDSKQFLARINTLKKKHASKTVGTALIQISDRPIYTVNGSHWMSEAINICGHHNVFADLATQSASVDIESIIAKNPDTLVRFSPLKPDETLSQMQQINAIKNQQVIVVNPDHFSRPTLRLLKAITAICQDTKKPVQSAEQAL